MYTFGLSSFVRSLKNKKILKCLCVCVCVDDKVDEVDEVDEMKKREETLRRKIEREMKK